MINDKADRYEIVQRLAELLTTKLVNEDDVVVAVYDYIPANPNGISPFVAVTAMGSNRSVPNRVSEFVVMVYVYVLYASKTANISERDAWLALSQIESTLARVLKSVSRAEGYWVDISWNEFSTVDVFPMDNQGYLIEVIPLVIKA